MYIGNDLCHVQSWEMNLIKWVPSELINVFANTLRPKQFDCLFADDTCKRIFLNENIRISIKISLKFVPKGLINNIPALVLIMAWRRSGDKPLSEPMIVRLLTHICVTRPQWVNVLMIYSSDAVNFGIFTKSVHEMHSSKNGVLEDNPCFISIWNFDICIDTNILQLPCANVQVPCLLSLKWS